MPATAGDTRSIQQALHDLGWPIAVDGSLGPTTRAAVSEFQHAFTLHDLVIDGFAGPQTCDALNVSVFYGGHASPHFTYREFACPSTRWIKVNRTLIRGLEKLRAAVYPGGMRVVSGYRDPAYNASVKGEPNSQHLYGAACDVDEAGTFARVRSLGVFSGIGIQRSNGLVRHVDVRGMDGAPATTPGTPANPSIWFYD